MIINISDDMIELNRAGLLKKLLEDKTTKGQILWGTDAYRERGPAFEREREIDTSLLLYENAGLLKTRARKAFEQQSERTRQHGEVFTPRWICDVMIDHLDKEWFGVKEIDFLSSMDVLFVKKKWKKYVDSKRLEITCGEGPFLVQRYDVSTGNIIPVPERKGILDRKLQVVSRYAETEEEWKIWAKRAYEATYGYEFQGDNLLISRVNFMMTYREFYQKRWQKEPELSEWEKIENIITWNLWQMDGLTGEIPYARMDPLGPDLFQLADPAFKEEDIHPACRIYDWRNENKSVVFNEIGKRNRGMKFDYIIGNPPYQENTAESTRKRPIYNEFMDASFSVASKVELITPARFLFDAGQTPKAWNKKMLTDNHFKVLKYIDDAAKVFPNTDIKGGVAITYHNEKAEYTPVGVFTKSENLNNILTDVRKKGIQSMSEIVSARGCYRLSDTFFKSFPEASEKLGKGTGNMIVSNIFQKVPEAFLDSPAESDSIKIVGRENNKRTYKFLSKKYLLDNEYVKTYNVLISEANNTGDFGETLVEPSLSKPGEGATDTFISIGFFHNQIEALNTIKYIKTKFCRAMLGVKKATQHTAKSVWEYVPIQNFSTESDIDWSKSIHEIDLQLYKKYGLSPDEIEFIESHVKEMK